MEKITSWTWRPDGKRQQEDSFFFNKDDNHIYLSRAGGEPQKAYKFNASWIHKTLMGKDYAGLRPNMQKLFDYLNAKLGK